MEFLSPELSDGAAVDASSADPAPKSAEEVALDTDPIIRVPRSVLTTATPSSDSRTPTPKPVKKGSLHTPKLRKNTQLPSSNAATPRPEAPLPTLTSQASLASRGAYGEEGLPAGTVDLYRAFLKTLPLAAKSDPEWLTLPPGLLGDVELLLSLDDSSKLQPVVIVDDPISKTPEILKRLVTLNRNFLLRGRFAIGPQAGEGMQRLRLTATLSSKAADPETPEAPGVRAFGIRGGSTPTGAYFTYFSGLHVELTLKRL